MIDRTILRRATLAGAAALAMFGLASPAFAQKTRLTVYTALENDQLDPFKKAFEADNPTIGGDAAFAQLAAAGADAVISGHVHVPFDQQRSSGGHAMRMIGTGTLSTRLRHDSPASWRVIECESGGVIATQLRLVGASTAAAI